MYRLARFYVRAALIYLAQASLIGALLMFNQGFALDSHISALQPVFYHLLMVGWATQLIGGVALWMFPPHTRQRPHGPEVLGWTSFVALNTGLICRAIGEGLAAWGVSTLPTVLLAASAVLQVLAAWLLVIALWPRVKGRITPLSTKVAR